MSKFSGIMLCLVGCIGGFASGLVVVTTPLSREDDYQRQIKTSYQISVATPAKVSKGYYGRDIVPSLKSLKILRIEKRASQEIQMPHDKFCAYFVVPPCENGFIHEGCHQWFLLYSEKRWDVWSVPSASGLVYTSPELLKELRILLNKE